MHTPDSKTLPMRVSGQAHHIRMVPKVVATQKSTKLDLSKSVLGLHACQRLSSVILNNHHPLAEGLGFPRINVAQNLQIPEHTQPAFRDPANSVILRNSREHEWSPSMNTPSTDLSGLGRAQHATVSKSAPAVPVVQSPFPPPMDTCRHVCNICVYTQLDRSACLPACLPP